MYFYCLCVFVSMYYVDLLHIPVLSRWLYLVGTLWDPVVQFLWSPELSTPGMSLVWVVCSLLLLSLNCCWYVSELGWSSHWLATRFGFIHSLWVAVRESDPVDWDLCQQALMLPETTLWVCCGRKLASVYVSSGAAWDRFLCSSRSAASCNQHRTTC